MSEKKRVLVVDDNATNRRILTLQGKTWGMNIRGTESPKEALKWIKRDEPFDLALLDMNMSEMNVLKYIRVFNRKLCYYYFIPRYNGVIMY